MGLIHTLKKCTEGLSELRFCKGLVLYFLSSPTPHAISVVLLRAEMGNLIRCSVPHGWHCALHTIIAR